MWELRGWIGYKKSRQRNGTGQMAFGFVRIVPGGVCMGKDVDYGAGNLNFVEIALQRGVLAAFFIANMR